MRLPADATLIVIDVQEAIDDPRWGPRNNRGAEDAIARLIARWRAEGLPLIHVRHNSVEPNSPYAPGAPGHRFKSCATPLEGERVVANPPTAPSSARISRRRSTRSARPPW